jgi:hypothetical protein
MVLVVTAYRFFKWTIQSGALETGQAFELIFWKEGKDAWQDGFGLTEPITGTEVRVDLNMLSNSHKNLLQPGNYKWGIKLVNVNPYTSLQFLGGGNQFQYGH